MKMKDLVVPACILLAIACVGVSVWCFFRSLEKQQHDVIDLEEREIVKEKANGSDFNRALEYTFESEGGLVDDTHGGGLTNFGVSKKFLMVLPLDDADINHDGVVDDNDILELTPAHCRQLYKKYFWDVIYANDIEDGRVATKYFDAAVNMGPGQAMVLMRRAIEATNPDANLGDRKRRCVACACNACDSNELLRAFCKAQENFYRTIAKKNPLKEKNLNGWLKRARRLPK